MTTTTARPTENSRQAAIAAQIAVLRGGPTSGNFGHKSTKGKRGGSKPGGGHSSLGLGSDASEAEKRKKVGAHREAQAATGGGTDQAAERLRTARITETQELGLFQRGAQESFVVELEDGTTMIAKPDQGAAGQSTAHAERMGYETARELGYSDLVPVTVVRNDLPQAGGKPASFQQWVDDADTYGDARHKSVIATGDQFPLKPPPPSKTQDVRNMVVLDYVIDQGDRNTGNLMIDNTGDVKAIDHGFAFGVRAELDNGFGRGVKDTIGPFPWRKKASQQYWNEASGQDPFDETTKFTLTGGELGKLRALRGNSGYLAEVGQHFGDESRRKLEQRLDKAIESGELF